MESGLTRAWVEIDLGALQRNALTIGLRASVPLLPMVKADAYGLGAIAVARALESIQPWGYGVATIEEGAELRASGITRPIVVFTPLPDAELSRLIASSLTPSLSRVESIARWIALGGAAWHLAIDTGMSRAGIRWDRVQALASAIREHPPSGAFTHFHSADRDPATITVQEARFREAIARLPGRPPLLHVENGAAIEQRPRSRWDMARPGIFLYGVSCTGSLAAEPVVHLRARIVDIRTLADGDTVSYLGSYRAIGPRRIATASIGYADGLRRALGNRGHAAIRGRRAPIAGLVTMDMTMLDVTDIECEIGDTATFIGRDGDVLIDVASVAEITDISPYEILTGLRGRLTRLYSGHVA
jgi:alanine racemase